MKNSHYNVTKVVIILTLYCHCLLDLVTIWWRNRRFDRGRACLALNGSLMPEFVGRDCGSTHVADDNRRSTTDSTERVANEGKQRLSVIRQSLCQRYYMTSEPAPIAGRISFRGVAI